MNRQASTFRFSFHPIFLKVIKKSHAKILRLDSRLKEVKVEDGNVISARIHTLEDELAETSLIVIIFSVMALEAYIYDYAARHLGDLYVKDHLDKLDTSSKWIVIPKLITGKEISRSGNWFSLLKKLVKARNSIIHYKSSEPPVPLVEAGKYFEKQRVYSKALLESAREAVTLLGILADKITELDPEEAPWVKSFLR
ncbi:MAG: hypothetical protein ACOYYI_07380 [Chloroflexota bacterium]